MCSKNVKFQEFTACAYKYTSNKTSTLFQANQTSQIFRA